MNKLLYLVISVVLIFTVSRFVNLGCDITSFIVAGDKSVDIDLHPYPIKIAQNSHGYDGQKFYHLALNPFDTKPYEFGIGTNLAYRKQRILYPLTAHLLAFRKHTLVPYSMVAVNLLCFVLFLLTVLKFLKYVNVKSEVLILFGCLPALYIALARDLAEVMGLMFVMMTLYAVRKKSIWLYVLLATCSILTREESVLVIFPASVYLGLSNWKKIELAHRNLLALFAISIPLLVFVIWKAFIYHAYGSYDNILVSIPLQGLMEGIHDNFMVNYAKPYSLLNRLFPFYCLYILFWYVITAANASRFLKFNEVSFRSMLSYSWLIWTIFLSFLPSIVYNEEISFARVLSVYGLLSLLLVVTHSKPHKLYYYFSGSMIFLIIIRLVLYP